MQYFWDIFIRNWEHLVLFFSVIINIYLLGAWTIKEYMYLEMHEIRIVKFIPSIIFRLNKNKKHKEIADQNKALKKQNKEVIQNAEKTVKEVKQASEKEIAEVKNNFAWVPNIILIGILIIAFLASLLSKQNGDNSNNGDDANISPPS